MKKFSFCFVCFLSLLLSACSGPKVVTMNQYDDVYMGEKLEDLEMYLGKPYSVQEVDKGVQEVVYIERSDLVPGKERFRTYTITVKDGKVIAKRFDETQTSPVEVYLE